MAIAAERIATAYRNADRNAMTSADRAYVDAVIKYETGTAIKAGAPPVETPSGPE
jgi:hypothetical protein